MMRRVAVVGNSGSGKSRLASELAVILGASHIELDGIIHQANWVDLDVAEFRRRVADLVAAPTWVSDGNYAQVRDLVWGRADTVVWLDLPRRTVMTRLVRRTLLRLVTRRELWNGNRETWRNAFSLDPDRSIILWGWLEHRRYQVKYDAARLEPRWAHIHFIRVQEERDRALLLRDARGTVSPGGCSG